MNDFEVQHIDGEDYDEALEAYHNDEEEGRIVSQGGEDYWLDARWEDLFDDFLGQSNHSW